MEAVDGSCWYWGMPYLRLGWYGGSGEVVDGFTWAWAWGWGCHCKKGEVAGRSSVSSRDEGVISRLAFALGESTWIVRNVTGVC